VDLWVVRRRKEKQAKLSAGPGGRGLSKILFGYNDALARSDSWPGGLSGCFPRGELNLALLDSEDILEIIGLTMVREDLENLP
jgi:hypothetical protein